MARTRKSHKADEEETKSSSSKLEPAYSPHVSGHRYVVYATLTKEGDPYSRSLVLKFLGTYAAQHFVKKLIGTDDIEWSLFMDRDEMITTHPTGITIRAHLDEMRKIYDHQPTEAESDWKDPRLIGSINQFRYGKHEAHKFEPIADYGNDNDGGLVENRGEDTSRDSSSSSPNGRKSPKPDRAPKPVREPRNKVDTSGHVSANDLAKKLGVEGREVRGVLRGLKLDKPAHGWSWPKKEAEGIEVQVIKALKQAKKK